MLKKIFSFLLIVLIVCGGIFAYFKFFGNKTAIIEVKKLDEISGYNYILQDNDTEIFKKYFNELDKVLTEKEINYEEYAKNIASLFIIDLYTINNKVNKYDIGGADYIEPTAIRL